MDKDQIKLVVDSWALLIGQPQRVADTFYGRLFETAPELKALFKGDMREQGDKLTQMLGMAVAGMRNFTLFEPTIVELGRKHGGYGVRARDYATVGDALLWTLERQLGPAYTPPVREAWTCAFETLAAAMKRGQGLSVA